MDELNLFIPISKIDEEKRLIYGRVTDESVDKSGEAFDYATSKPYFEKWSGEIAAATEGKSVGNLRSMHGNKVAGKLTELVFDDASKSINCVAKVLDENEWQLCLEGAYTGFSQGGRYVRRWTDSNDVKRFTVQPSEVSLVDNPCLTSARFTLVKSDGSEEERPFAEPKEEPKTETPPITDPPATDTPASDPPNTDDDDSQYVKGMAALGYDHSELAIRQLIRENNARFGQGV